MYCSSLLCVQPHGHHARNTTTSTQRQLFAVKSFKNVPRHTRSRRFRSCDNIATSRVRTRFTALALIPKREKGDEEKSSHRWYSSTLTKKRANTTTCAIHLKHQGTILWKKSKTTTWDPLHRTTKEETRGATREAATQAGLDRKIRYLTPTQQRNQSKPQQLLRHMKSSYLLS